ncbi:MAG: RNA polymerase sigma factor, partial [Candidatus Acidiferrales bacterium]
NLALNSIRDYRHHQLDVSIDVRAEQEDGRTFELRAREKNIDQQMLENDRATAIRRAVDALPDKQRAAVLLHKYEEMDYAQISKVLDCTESALKSLLFRAYETLRVQLAPLAGLAAAQTAPGVPLPVDELGKGRTS